MTRHISCTQLTLNLVSLTSLFLECNPLQNKESISTSSMTKETKEMLINECLLTHPLTSYSAQINFDITI